MLALPLALRYLRRRRAAWLAFGTAVCSVMVPVVVMGVMQGWLEVSSRQLKAANADFELQFRWAQAEDAALGETLADVPGVASVAPYLGSEGVFIVQRLDAWGDRRETSIGCRIDGISWEADRRIGRLGDEGLHQPPAWDLREEPLAPGERGSGFLSMPAREHLVDLGQALLGPLGGNPQPVLPRLRSYRPGVVIGRELGYLHSLQVGDEGRLFRLYGNGRKRDISVEISDSVGTGDYEIDKYTVFTSLPVAQYLTGRDGRHGGPATIDGYRIALDGSRDHEVVAAELRDLVGERGRLRHWTDIRASMMGMLRVTRRVVVVVAVALQLLCLFVIFAVFSTLVAEKRHDIGVLRAIGASRTSIRGAFLIAGAVACALGGSLGWLLGWGVLAALNPTLDHFGVPLFPQDVIYTPTTPISYDPGWPLLFLALMTSVGLLAALLPAARAARIDPIASIRGAD